MNINNTRQRRLAELIRKYGSQKRVVDAMDKKFSMEPNYMSQLNTGRRPITEKTARKLESALGLPNGWMDESEDQGQSGINKETLNEIISLFGDIPQEAHSHVIEVLRAINKHNSEK